MQHTLRRPARPAHASQTPMGLHNRRKETDRRNEKYHDCARLKDTVLEMILGVAPEADGPDLPVEVRLLMEALAWMAEEHWVLTQFARSHNRVAIRAGEGQSRIVLRKFASADAVRASRTATTDTIAPCLDVCRASESHIPRRTSLGGSRDHRASTSKRQRRIVLSGRSSM